MYIRNIDDIFCNIKEQVNDVNECQHSKTIERTDTPKQFLVSVRSVSLCCVTPFKRALK